MGSSRSGLVFHAAPMVGRRTGFYSDEFLHAGYKAPEEIRKDNLCRADLRGAQIFDAADQCRADGISCLIGTAARADHVDFCNLTVRGASDVATGKRIAVAALLAAAHTCE